MSEGYTDDKVKQITQEAYEQAQRLGMSSRVKSKSCCKFTLSNPSQLTN